MNFKAFSEAVNRQWAAMEKHKLFVVNLDKDQVWDAYLAAFPEGTNPIYRERTTNDCSCCKSFIRKLGNVVAISNGKVSTIWDVTVKDEPVYTEIAAKLAQLVRSAIVRDVFLTDERHVGAAQTFEDVLDGKTKTWNHFYARVADDFVVARAESRAQQIAGPRESKQVMVRGFDTITDHAIETVLDLISQNSLYRGTEFKGMVESFRRLKKDYMATAADARDLFAWERVSTVSEAVARIRNTAIGSLLVDLSEGMEEDRAVAAFELKVAGPNYKRPTALVTPAMVKKAKETVEELGLTSALQRRYATLDDIDINNLLFADRSVKKRLNGDVFDEVSDQSQTKVTRELSKVEEMNINDFVRDVLPRVSSIELLLENKHQNHMVSLIAPTDASAGRLFKWNNPFSWSYAGEVADSIKERVKAAGGNVTGDLCCRLAWSNYDDLDLHMIEPDGYEIYFGNRGNTSPSGGRLDVDMNAGMGKTRTPVENIFYQSASRMKEGVYKLIVHQFCQRERTNVGFEVEIDMLGDVMTFSQEAAVPDRQHIVVAEIKYSKRDGFSIINSMNGGRVGGKSRQLWNLQTNTFVPVKAIMKSPNFWEGEGVGNKHLFFMLDGCVNDGTARSFYNEFLDERLDKHRKVMEIVGSKTKVEDCAEQLSGVGVSSTQKHNLTVRVKGAFTRTLKLVF